MKQVVSGLLNAHPPNTFMNARFLDCIWPSGITRQDSRNYYFIFVSVGTEEVSHRLVPGKSGGIAAVKTLWRTDSFISPSRKPS